MLNAYVQKKEKEHPSIGTVQAVICGVYAGGMSEYKGVWSERFSLTYELDERLKAGEYAGERFHFSKYYKNNLWKAKDGTRRSALREVVDACGIELTAGQEKGEEAFDLEQLYGQNVQVEIALKENGYTDVVSVIPIRKNDVPMDIEVDNGEPEWVTKGREEGNQAYAKYKASLLPSTPIMPKQTAKEAELEQVLDLDAETARANALFDDAGQS
jgi:hypothetical protein